MSSNTTQKQPQECTTTMRDLNVLIVGASGHLGSHICQYMCDNHKDKVKLSLLVPEDSRQKIASCESKITGSILTFDVLNGEVDDLVMMLRDEQYTLVINTMNFFDSKEELKAETNLIRAVSEAGVKYYIPADFSIDFRDIKADANLPKIEVRQQIHKLLNQTTNLKWISILCGVFVEKLLFEDFHMLFDRDRKTFSYYGTGDEEFQVSTYDDVAKFVSELIVRREFQKYNNQFLSIYSEQVTFKTLANWMKDIWGKDLKLQSLGNVSELKQRISQVKNTDPVQFFYMQLLMVILMKESKIKQLDNQVWPTIKKVGVKDVIRNWSTKSSNIAL